MTTKKATPKPVIVLHTVTKDKKDAGVCGCGCGCSCDCGCGCGG